VAGDISIKSRMNKSLYDEDARISMMRLTKASELPFL